MWVRSRWVGVVAVAVVLAALVGAACGGKDGAPPPADTALAGAIRGIFLAGEGDGVVSFEAAGGLTVIDLGHVGDGRFRVELSRAEGAASSETLVEQVGSWGGSVGLGLAAGGYQLEVVADGVWFADVRQPRDEPAVAVGAYEGNRETYGRWDEEANVVAREARANGEFVFGESRWSVTPPFALAGAVSAGFVYREERAFGVWWVDERGAVVEELARGVGGRERAAAFNDPAGVSRVVVQADGVWSLVIRPGGAQAREPIGCGSPCLLSRHPF